MTFLDEITILPSLIVPSRTGRVPLESRATLEPRPHATRSEEVAVLEPEFIERMRQELLRMRAEILQQLRNDKEEIRTIIDDESPKDSIDIASDDTDKFNLENLSQLELQRLRMIDAALERMNRGLYGICADTGKPIPKARLEAIPYTILSVEAQAAREKAKKR